MDYLRLSPLAKTWLLDVDGTLVKHNGHLYGDDEFLEGAEEFLKTINKDDKVILLTSREEKYKKDLESFLERNNIRYDCIIYGLPYGERILVNDKKTSGLKTAYAINKSRDDKVLLNIEIDESL